MALFAVSLAALVMPSRVSSAASPTPPRRVFGRFAHVLGWHRPAALGGVLYRVARPFGRVFGGVAQVLPRRSFMSSLALPRVPSALSVW